MWFLSEKIKDRIEKSKVELSASLIAVLERRRAGFGVIKSGGNKTAVIPIEGVLTKNPDNMAAFFGGGNTTYKDIIDSIVKANSDSSFSEIVLDVGYSPGGNMIGMFDAMDAIKNSKKPVTARVQNGALSAAYGLVSQASSIIAGSRATMFGSVGVVHTSFKNAEKVEITSTEAPNKRPDLDTDEGVGVIRKELDDIHAVFVDSIAAGRGTTIDKINSDFGRGSVLLAGEALRVGMIDSIGDPAKSAGEKIGKGNEMDLTLLKKDFPGVYQAAVDEGISEERDRVLSHLELGEACGEMSVALNAIKDGSGLTAKLQSEYLSARMRSLEATYRVNDNVDTDGGADTTGGDGSQFDEQVCAKVERMLGVDNG